jgi:hypothetical protein
MIGENAEKKVENLSRPKILFATETKNNNFQKFVHDEIGTGRRHGCQIFPSK